MPDQFVYATNDVLRMLDVLVDTPGGGRRDKFFADRTG
jgi:hypothetical protein